MPHVPKPTPIPGNESDNSDGECYWAHHCDDQINGVQNSMDQCKLQLESHEAGDFDEEYGDSEEEEEDKDLDGDPEDLDGLVHKITEETGEHMKDTSNVFCPALHHLPILCLFAKPHALHPNLLEQHTLSCTATEIHTDAILKMYTHCKRNNLLEVWAYMWNCWYCPPKKEVMGVINISRCNSMETNDYDCGGSLVKSQTHHTPSEQSTSS
ncbi:hypothetical protein M422DRAFT_242432 [Sphaerobolus stellatus SS14]|nr:hypothetical protein M422DRAFT_242432 [Sphaerobolus stellatus SS14]